MSVLKESPLLTVPGEGSRPCTGPGEEAPGQSGAEE